MGNSEVVLEKSSLQVRRTGKKNYFTGNIEDLTMDIVEIVGFGQLPEDLL